MEHRSRGSSGARPLLFAVERRPGVQGALLHSVPGRAIVVGLAVTLLVWLVGLVLGAIPAFLTVVDTLAGPAVAAGLTYFLLTLLAPAGRRLLWRVRRKLILSYIFIGFVPALLIVAFFLLSGFLLFSNVSSYLVQSRLHAVGERAQVLAASAALEIRRGGGRDAAAILTRRLADDMTMILLKVDDVEEAVA